MQVREIYLGDSVMIADNLDAKEDLKQGEYGDLPHRLTYNTILFIDRGGIEARINMKEFSIGAGSIFLAPAGAFLDRLAYQTGTRFLMLGYSDTSLFFSMSGRSARIIRAAMYTPLHLPVMRERMDRYMQVLRVLMHVADGGPDYSFKEDIINGFATIISGGIARIILERDKKRTESGRPAEIMKKFVSLVQADCMTHRDLGHYADRLCISSKYLSRVVKAVSGKNAGVVISENVVPIAQRLLLDGRYNVQQVCNMMSFPNPSYFCRYFFRSTGQTPREFQHRFRGE